MSVRVRRANGERIIPDEKVAEYLEMGYSVLDAKGNVVKRPEPKTIPELKAVIAEKDKIIAELTAENEKLKADLAEKDAATTCNTHVNGGEQDTPTISTSEEKNGANAPSEKKKAKAVSKPE